MTKPHGARRTRSFAPCFICLFGCFCGCLLARLWACVYAGCLVCLFAYVCVCLWFCLSVCLSACLTVRLALGLSVCLSVSVYLSVSVCPTACGSVCLCGRGFVLSVVCCSSVFGQLLVCLFVGLFVCWVQNECDALPHLLVCFVCSVSLACLFIQPVYTCIYIYIYIYIYRFPLCAGSHFACEIGVNPITLPTPARR